MQLLKQPLLIAPPSAESPEGVGFFLVFMAVGFLALALISLRRRSYRRYLSAAYTEQSVARRNPIPEAAGEVPDCSGACAARS